MIVAEFSVIPLGTETPCVSKYVMAALEELKDSEIRFESGAMGTVIEAKDIRTIFGAIERAHEAVFRAGAKRVVTRLTIDDRRDKELSIESKLKAIEQGCNNIQREKHKRTFKRKKEHNLGVPPRIDEKHKDRLNERIMEYIKFYETPFGQGILRRESTYIRDWLHECNRILDVGCGPGIFEEKLSDLNIVGVDSDPEMVQAAKQKVENEFRLANAEELPFPDASFDGIFFVTSLEFIEAYIKAIDEAARVLSRRGRIVALILNPESQYFKDRLSRGGYIAESVKHTDIKGIKSYLSTKFDISGGYFLGVTGNRVFDSDDPSYASLYAIRCRLK